jgi:hypothetical protein
MDPAGIKNRFGSKTGSTGFIKNQKNWSENLIRKIWERNLQSFTGPFS